MKACLNPGVKKELIDERVGREVIAFGQRQATEEEEGEEKGGRRGTEKEIWNSKVSKVYLWTT